MPTESAQEQSRIPAVPIALAIAAVVLLLDDYTPQEMPPQFLYVLCVLLAVALDLLLLAGQRALTPWQRGAH